jgi:surface antigen
MLSKLSILLAATAVVCGATAGYADPWDHTDQGYGQSRSDRNAEGDRSRSDYSNGYQYGYDDGYARRTRNDQYRSDPYHAYHAENRGYERGAYYYGSDCGSNAAAGTLLGAAAGGMIGNQFGHGDGRTAATVGGVILGGIAGNAIASDMNCNDRRYAFTSYRSGFDGRIGQRYDWRNNDSGAYGSFTPVREYSRNQLVCRDYRAATWRDGREYDRTGTACRQADGNWYLQ